MVPPLSSRLFNSFASAAAGNATRASATRLAMDARDGVRAHQSVSSDWQVTDVFHQAENDPRIVFTEDLLNETTEQMIGPAYRVEEPEEGSGANVVMQAADAQMRGLPMGPLIHSMLRDPDIQRSTLAFLARSPDFQTIRRTIEAGPVAAPLPIEWHASEVEEVNEEVGLQGMIEDLGAKLMAAGQAALHTAVTFRNALGRFLINLGASLHALLGRPFSTSPLEEDNEEQLEERAEVVGQALVTVAVTILSIVLLKRMHVGAAAGMMRGL